jgi:hypothetical protein
MKMLIIFGALLSCSLIYTVTASAQDFNPGHEIGCPSRSKALDQDNEYLRLVGYNDAKYLDRISTDIAHGNEFTIGKALYALNLQKTFNFQTVRAHFTQDAIDKINTMTFTDSNCKKQVQIAKMNFNI